MTGDGPGTGSDGTVATGADPGTSCRVGTGPCGSSLSRVRAQVRAGTDPAAWRLPRGWSGTNWSPPERR
jgi:hypothetical protein